MSVNWCEDIANIHEHYEVYPAIDKMDPETLKKFLKFRIDFLQEELDEMKTAKNAEDVVDALIDLCVVAIGTLDCFSVNSHMAWDEVLKANMRKNVGVKASRPNPLGLPDLIKPVGWEAPSHEFNHGLLGSIKYDD